MEYGRDTSMDRVNCAQIENLLSRLVVNKRWVLPQKRIGKVA